jgi:hypothetical protein
MPHDISIANDLKTAAVLAGSAGLAKPARGVIFEV